MKSKFLIIIILILAAALRLWQLNTIPPSLNWDEISLGYNSYSILKTGQDEWGNFLPLSFKAFGDYKLPGYVYLDVPFTFFGLNEWTTRLPSAILGIGFVLLTYLILKKLQDEKTAIWASLIAAIIPWTIITSRIALEAQLAFFLTVLGFYFFLIGLKKNLFLLLSSFCFGLTIFSYNSSRIVTPILLIFLASIWWKDLSRQKLFSTISFLIFLLFFIIALPYALLQDSSARYRWTTILDEGAINSINESRRVSKLPENLKQLTYNKVTYFAAESSKNYISHFSPSFLFISGGSNYQFNVPGIGLIYPVILPVILLGLWQVFKEKKRWQIYMLAWVLVAPIPAAITRDSPHSLRSIMMIFPLVAISGLGFKALTLDKRHIISILALIVLSFNLFWFWGKYSLDYVRDYSWSWQYGYKQVIDLIRSDSDQYTKIYFTKKYGEPHEFILFYLNYDPEKYRNDNKLVRYQKSDWFWVDGFDKFIFLNDWEIKDKAKCDASDKCLLISSPGNYPKRAKLKKTITFLDGQAAFDVVQLEVTK